MLRDIEFYHGAALARLVRASHEPIEFELLRWDRSFNAYLINQKTGLYLKYSTHRLPPWQFMFTPEQRSEVAALAARTERTVVGLVCWEDGIVGLSRDEVTLLMGDAHSDETSWISISRKKRGQYQVRGSLGELGRRLSRSDFAAAVGVETDSEDDLAGSS